MENIRTYVDDGGGLAALTMAELRDEHGVSKLGVHVRQNISRELAGHGLGHFPRELPSHGSDEVRVYRLGTPVAELVDAVLEPSDRGDERLREAANHDTAAIIETIKELVCA